MNDSTLTVSENPTELEGHEVEILLVEDNPNDARLTLRALERGKVANHVHMVTNGAEALDVLFSEGKYAGRVTPKPKVVLLDLKLPLLNGIEVLQRIKNDSRTHAIPIVALTSSAEDRDLNDCYKLGVNSYIVKPVGVDDFFNAIREVGFYWLALNHPTNE